MASDGSVSGGGSGSGSGSDSDTPPELFFVMEKLLGDLNLQDFRDDVWGKEVYASRVAPGQLKCLRQSFFNCNVGEVIQACRKEDNSLYSSAESDGLEGGLDSNNRTIILPFCFTPGAIAIKRAFIEQCEDLGNDVEVGVYVSRVGGDPAPWHFDNNHNLTIQISGQKEWLVRKGTNRTMASTPMSQPARNSFEAARPIPPVGRGGPDGCEVYTMRPGSVLYLPPGCWHSVVPTGGESFSVDLRVANIVQARWISEVVFAMLTRPVPDLPVVHGQDFEASAPLGADARKQAAYIQQGILENLSRIRMPRAFPFEPAHSDGLHIGATLEYLREMCFYDDLDDFAWERDTYFVNPLVSLHASCLDGGVAVRIRSVSSLTESDYVNMTILCREWPGGAAEFAALLNTSTPARIPKALAESDLWGVLVKANVVCVHKGGATTTADGQTKTTTADGQDKTTTADGQDKTTTADGQDKTTTADGQDKTTTADGQDKKRRRKK